MKNYSFWLKASIVTQILTGIFHTLSIVSEPTPKNETEKTLLDLMQQYKFDLGSGFRHSMDDIMLAFSINFTLLLFFSAAINYFLLNTCTEKKVLKGIVGINIVTFGICFVTMALFTFLPPIICSGLIVLFLFVAYIKLNKN